MSVVQKDDVRPYAVADAFYPAHPSLLDEQLDSLLEKAESSELAGEIKGLISPHAGYIYSGLVAAAGYKQLLNHHYSVIAIISPSHHEKFPGISVFNGKGYLTPLGLLSVATDYADLLIEEDDSIHSSWAGHHDEHALEVQLPFLQKVLDDFSIIPIVMGEQKFETCRILGNALAKTLKDVPALIIASSDLSHFYSYEEASQVDQSTISLIETYDEEEFVQGVSHGKAEACGAGPIVAAMIATKKAGATEVQVFNYKNSGDTGPNRDSVVGYVSAGFIRL